MKGPESGAQGPGSRFALPDPECTVLLRLMAELNRKPDFVIYVSNPNSVVTGKFTDEIAAYEAKYQPRAHANLTVELSVS